MGSDVGQRPERNEPKIMMINEARTFYSGLLGRKLGDRVFGSLMIYHVQQGHFRISVEGGPWREETTATVLPYQPHTVSAAGNRISTISIEPESVSQREMDAAVDYAGSHDGRKRIAHSVGALISQYPDILSIGSFRTEQFDEFFFGRALQPRNIDERLLPVLVRIDTEGDLSAHECARQVRLSPSRFLRLFKEEVEIPFRRYRMWRRARALLYYANTRSNITSLAMDLGYPDSSHFSHSIRRFYGLTPRAIIQGSQDLLLMRGDRELQ